MSSGRDDYRTPPDLFMDLNREFHFTVDRAADESNALVPRYHSGPHNPGDACDCGLCASVLPSDRVWVNPPYSRLLPWIQSFAWLGTGVPVVAVLPYSASSVWWRYMVATCHELRFPRDRIQFLHAPGCTCQACARGERASNRGENVIAIWLPYRRPVAPAVRWGWQWGGTRR